MCNYLYNITSILMLIINYKYLFREQKCPHLNYRLFKIKKKIIKKKFPAKIILNFQKDPLLQIMNQAPKN